MSAAAKTLPREPALRVTTLERESDRPDGWSRSLVTVVPLDAVLDLPVGPNRRLIVEEVIDSQETV